MSSKIDERIVGMKFNGDQFQKGVADTSSALDKLKRALNLDGAAKGLNDLDAAGKNFSLANLANGVQDIAAKFGALSVVGITALANIANKAVDAGLTIMRSLTIDPIKAGFAEYELKMGSIQTILANTARYGTTLEDVTANLDELNAYADKTIYNFGDMTKNIGLFTNAGIRIEDATKMIQGFSNAAASSGTNAQGAAGAATQLAQALNSGIIRAQDWISLTNVGMGNKNMTDGLYQIAVGMGKVTEGTELATKIQGNFKGSLEENWLSADIMSQYLKIMAQDNYDSAKAMALATGMTEAQSDALAKQVVTANDAAKKVRTFTQLLGTMQESVGSGWSETMGLLIGDFNQATDMWTAVNEELGGIIDKMSKARNDLIRAFVEGGGREMILGGIAAIWNAAKAYFVPIKEAFQEIFPPITAQNLLDIAKNFQKFAESLKPSKETLDNLKRTFMGVFAVFDIGWMVLKEVVGLFARLFGAATEGAGGVLGLTANIGDFLVKVRDAIKDGTALEKFFQTLGDVLQWPIEKLRELGKWTINAVGTWDLAKAWEAVANAFRKIGEFLAPVWETLGDFFRNAKEVLGEFFQSLDFNVLVGLMNFGALGAIGIGLKKAFGFLKDKGIMGLIFGDKKESGPGMIDTIKSVFGAITDTFSELQNTLKSGTLIGIGIAIGLITASVVALSFVDTGKLFIVLGAMTIMFGQLSAMLVAIDKLTKTVKTSKMVGVALALGILAGAMILMSTAILILTTMDWNELARGLVGLALGLGTMVVAMMAMDKIKQNMIESAAAILIMSGAMLIMSVALKIMSTMSWDDILRSMVALVGVLTSMVVASKFAQKAVKGVGALILMGLAIGILSGALKVFSTMSWDDILRASVMMGFALGAMVGALMVLDKLKFSPVGAGTMIAMAFAITILAGAMKVFGSMNWEQMGISLIMLAGSLGILAAAMYIMGNPMVALGGLALFVVSAGMMMLAPALKLLGTMSWDAIGRGLTMLGASLAILAVGGLLLIPASVGFLLFGAAMLMIGGAVMMVGQGLALFTLGFTGLVAAATMGAPAIKTAMETIASAIPAMMAAFAQGIIDFALVIAGGAVEFTAAATTLIQSFLMGLQQNGPLMIQTLTMLISEMLTSAQTLIPQVVDLGILIVLKFLEAMVTLIPAIVNAGMLILIGVLDGIGRNIGRVVDSATTIVVNFIDGIARNLPRIIQSGINLIISFVQGLADGINQNRARMNEAGGNLAMAILDGMTNGLASGVGKVIKAAADVAGKALKAAKDFLGIKSPSREFFKVGAWSSEGMAIGIEKTAPVVTRAAENVGDGALTAMQKSLSNLKNAVAMDMEFAPTIRPVLDLSNVQKNSALIGGMLTPPTLKVDDSYAYAASIAQSQREFEDSRNDGEGDNPTGDVINFTQINNSPKALPASEIYRQTHNQLSVVKKGQPSA